jgi:hypothetical protein
LKQRCDESPPGEIGPHIFTATVTPIAIHSARSRPAMDAYAPGIISPLPSAAPVSEASEPPPVDTPVSVPPEASDDWENKYKPVLDEYREFAAQYKKNMNNTDFDWDSTMGSIWLYMRDQGFTVLGYAFRDLDNNGTPELFLLGGVEKVYIDSFDISAIYTYNGRKPVLLGLYRARDACHIAEDTFIYNNWSNGASDCGTDVYRISEDGQKLDFVERVAMESYYGMFEEPRFYRCVGSEDNKEIISEAEARSEMSEFPYDNTDSGLEFIPIGSAGTATAPSVQETEEINTAGNTAGNIINGGIVAQQGDWIYYQNVSDHSNLYKVRTDGTQATKLNDRFSSYINIVGDWIYYSNGVYLYKIRTDGTQETKLSDRVIGSLSVVDDWIYFSLPFDLSLYKIHTDGTEETELSDDVIQYFNIVDGWIYYVDSGMCINKMRTDGTGEIKLYDYAASDINVVGDWIYFWGRGLEKIRTDGTGRTTLFNDDLDYINVVGDWIYYTPLNDGSIFKIRTDGTGRTQLNSDFSVNINIVGDWVYYINYSDHDNLYRMKTDGTGRQVVQ